MNLTINNEGASTLTVSRILAVDGAAVEIRYNNIAVAFISNGTQFGIETLFLRDTYVSILHDTVALHRHEDCDGCYWVLLVGEL